jgi:DNA polymerase III epsilon subunit family exonuclease
MRPSLKYWIFILGIAFVIFSVILASVLGSWLNLSTEEQAVVMLMAEKILPFPILGAFIIVAVIGGLVTLLFRYYIIPILQMAESTHLISLANPNHRIPSKGAREVTHLAEIINSSADAFQKLRLEVDNAIRLAQADLAEERNRFAALMSELPAGVVVCNIDGQILLYNQHSQALLQPHCQEKFKRSHHDGWIGLGRSIFGLLHREQIVHGLDLLQLAVAKGEEAPVTRFMAALDGNRSLRATMAPVFGFRADSSYEEGKRRMTGMVITLEDITSLVETDKCHNALVQSLTGQLLTGLKDLQRSVNTEQVADREQPASFCTLVDRICSTMQEQIISLLQRENARHLQLTGKIEAIAEEQSLELPHQHLRSGLAVPREARPVYYEFDLFKQRAPQEMIKQQLRKLVYVVFDTETTGLDPANGDEIIQIGAVRIVNGRILADEVIDQLINPKRSVPDTSVAIHGISPEMLVDQPTIEEVLPHFHKFAEGAVLVAHNAAFDMRCLQLKEESTGLRFDHPVLDTLLLSSVIHPHQEAHSLDGIAKRLDLAIVGRHTALGDAIVTAEVLLKMIPLLESQGVMTLEDAMKASVESRFAKLNY